MELFPSVHVDQVWETVVRGCASKYVLALPLPTLLAHRQEKPLSSQRRYAVCGDIDADVVIEVLISKQRNVRKDDVELI